MNHVRLRNYDLQHTHTRTHGHTHIHILIHTFVQFLLFQQRLFCKVPSRLQPAKNRVHDYEKTKCINGGSGEDLVEIYVLVGELVQLAAK